MSSTMSNIHAWEVSCTKLARGPRTARNHGYSAYLRATPCEEPSSKEAVDRTDERGYRPSDLSPCDENVRLRERYRKMKFDLLPGISTLRLDSIARNRLGAAERGRGLGWQVRALAVVEIMVARSRGRLRVFAPRSFAGLDTGRPSRANAAP